MIEKIVVFVSRIVFGKQYLDGYINEPEEKREYKLMPLFPNQLAKDKVTTVLKKDNLSI